MLQKQQEKDNFIAAYNVMHSKPTGQPHQESTIICQESFTSSETAASFSKPEARNADTEIITPEKMWSDEPVIFLITLCKKYDKEFDTGIKKNEWSKIANEISRKFSHTFTPQQCDTKFKGLKNMYKQVKKHNEQSGNNVKQWKFYDLMNDLLYTKPEINALATCSSRNGLKKRSVKVSSFGDITSGKFYGKTLHDNSLYYSMVPNIFVTVFFKTAIMPQLH